VFENHIFSDIHAMDLENVFGKIKADGGDHHGGPPLSQVSIDDDQRKAPRCRVHGASTSSDMQALASICPADEPSSRHDPRKL
jgi:hypothetical protein